jgi:hypothetical protein
MFREPLRISRPALKNEVRALVDLVCHRPEGHTLPLEEIVRMLGIRLAPRLQEELRSRGDLHFAADHFRNQGPPIERKVRLMGFDLQLHIAPELRGTLQRFSHSFQLGFEPDHSVSGSKFLFQFELRRMDLSYDRIFVNFAGAQDVFIDLG